MTVKRYTPTQCCEHDGTYVTYSDYQKLVAENLILKAAFKPADIPSELTDVFGDTAVIEHDSTGDNQGHSVSWSWVGNQEDVIKAVLSVVASRCETPATDAAIAEIKAQGVALAISHLSKKFTNLGVPITSLEWLEVELRAGRKG